MWKLFVAVILPALVFAEQCPLLQMCVNPIKTTILSGNAQTLIPSVSAPEFLDHICSELPAVQSCISMNLDWCKSEKNKLEAQTYEKMAAYMCTPAGRQVVLDLQKSSCTDSPDFAEKFDTLVRGCVHRYAADQKVDVESKGRPLTDDETCSHSAKLIQCVSAQSSQMCGPEMGVYTEQLWKISFATTFGSRFGCSYS